MAAIGTETVTLMPVEERARLRQKAQITGRKKALDGEAPEIAGILRNCRFLAGEDGMALSIEAQKDGVFIDRLFIVKRARDNARFVAIEAQQTRLWIGPPGCNPMSVATKSGGPIK
jgi:hypothetical protein